MITFIVVAAAMLLAALFWILVPLLTRRPAASIGREASNLAILRDAYAELDADLANGNISTAQHAISRAELDRRVQEETRVAEAEATTPHRSGALTASLLAAVLAIFAVVLYLVFGTPQALSPQAARKPAPADDQRHASSPQKIDAMIELTKQKLAKDPSNVEGWLVLARTYYVTGRAEEAAKAYERVTILVPDNADLLADYADALGLAQGRTLDGKPEAIIAQALKADPKHWKANALAGTIALSRKEYAKAVTHWERAKAGVPPESPIAQSIGSSLERARQLAGMPVATAPAPVGTAAPSAPPGGSARVTGRVALAPELATGVSPEDAVFVFARPAQGARAPLALLTRKVKDLPLEFTLDDSMAMAPNLKLSDHREVVVGARVSRTGSPMPASGDLEGLSAPVKLGASGVALTIDKRIP